MSAQTPAVTKEARTTEEEVAQLSKPKASTSSRVGGIAAIVGMVLILAYCIFPFYFMIVAALYPDSAGGIKNNLNPFPATFENLASVFDPSNGFVRALLNSLIVSTSTTLLTLVFGILGSYALARLRFKLKALALSVIIGISMFPGVTLLIPLLKMFSGYYDWLPLQWINTYQALILPSLSFALPLCVWNLTAFFRQLPVELEQAAMVDGCTPGVAFRKVILPLAAPGVFTTAIITFIAVWNEFLIALTFTSTPQMATSTVAISKFTGSLGFNTPYGTIMAAGVVVTVPLLIAVLIFQRRIVAGLTAGGVK